MSREERNIEAIANSPLFDAGWYRRTYPDVAHTGLDPARHYLEFGAALGRDPGPGFSTRAYLSRHREFLADGANPLVHYETEGRRRDLKIAPAARPALRPVRDDAAPRRVAIFSAVLDEGRLPRHATHFLTALSGSVDHTIVATNGPIAGPEVASFADAATFVASDPETGLFGRYARGYAEGVGAGLLDGCGELILCSDGCFGPVAPLEAAFAGMAARDCDAWSITESADVSLHLHACFLCLRRDALDHPAFGDMLDESARRASAAGDSPAGEIAFTDALRAAGLRTDALVQDRIVNRHPLDQSRSHIDHYPLRMIAAGAPLIPIEALRHAASNLDGIDRTLDHLAGTAPDLHALALADERIARHRRASDVAFSIIMPTRDRKHLIGGAIDAVLAQTHARFELIVIDDGSTDGTGVALAERYGEELASGRMRYLHLGQPSGVCQARNVGLSLARHDWIAYADSDNAIRPHFLTLFANAVVEHPEAVFLYGQFCRDRDGTTIGQWFDRAKLSRENYIDLGVLIHRRSLFARHGGFDPDLKRLVDWDLAVRYTAEIDPVFLERVVMDYSDAHDLDRISRRESYTRARMAVLRKNRSRITISTAIVCYNQADYLPQAIESALAQEGDFVHEIVVADDGSTDGSQALIADYVARHPRRVSSIGTGTNVGISENYRRSFAHAVGEFTSILEGDDYWTDPGKLAKQAAFLTAEPDTSMVFSRIRLQDERNGTSRLLERHERLRSNRLNGRDFLNHSAQNLIVNFSSCMFRTALMQSLPEALYAGRLSEIPLAFHLERIGPIGFLDEVMGIYRQHHAGVWSGIDRKARLESGLLIRRTARQFARPEYWDALDRIIELDYLGPLADLR